LAIAEGKDLERVSKQRGQWFIKGSTTNYEVSRLKQMLFDGVGWRFGAEPGFEV